MGIATQGDIAKSNEKIAFNKARLIQKQKILGESLTDDQKRTFSP